MGFDIGDLNPFKEGFNAGDALLTAGTGGLWGVGKAVANSGVVGDYINDQYNNYDPQGFYNTDQYNPDAFWYGGKGEGWADYYYNDAMNRAAQQNAQDARMQNRANMAQNRMVQEDPILAQREANAASEQQGSLQLAREAAMGQAPSEAAYMMQRGLDQGLAAQQSLAGSARGAAGLAMAQQNMGENAANMQQQAFTSAGQLRAQEMANARAQYGQLAGQQRQADQARLNMGNQMGQFNRSANDSYSLGLGNQAIGRAQLANNYYGMGQSVVQGNQAGQMGQQEMLARDLESRRNAQAGISAQNTVARQGLYNKLFDFVGGTGRMAASGGGMGGSKT